MFRVKVCTVRSWIRTARTARRPVGSALARGVGAVAFALVAAAAAAGSADHERARAAVQSGAVLPLHTVLERLQRSHPGQVLEVELERDDGRWVYEVRLLQADGRLLKLVLDARTAEVLTQRARGVRPPPPAAPAAPPPAAAVERR